MSFSIDSKIREVSEISEIEKQRMIDFFQGAIYCWCKNRKDEWFSIRDLMGGDNYYWDGTPLLPLYNKHIGKGKEEDDAVRDAGIDSGWILKKTTNVDKRNFDTKKEDLVRKYRWIGNEK